MSRRPNEAEHKTTCCYCGVGCGIVLTDKGNGALHVRGDETHPSSKGMLCSKGMNLHYTAMDDSDRLLYPQMRMNRSMPMQRVSWENALDRTARIFNRLIGQYGPDSVGFYISGQCLTEEYYVINKLMKGFVGSNNIDTNSRLCMSSAVVGYKMTLGEDSVPVSYEDLDIADCFFVAGSNAAWAHPVIWRRIEANKQRNPDVKIIVVDPRRTQTASVADLHLPLRPGTDVTLYLALARILIENGWIDRDFIHDHTEGFDTFREAAFRRTVAEAAGICGLPEEDVRLAARYIHESQGFMTLWTMGLNQSVIGVNKNVSLIALNLLTGRIGKPGNGPFSLTGQPNAMGGREVGGLANLLPAHRDLGNAGHRAEIERFWQAPVPINPNPGLTATEMVDALLDGRMKAIWIACTNPMVSLPDSDRVARALQKARLVVVQDVSSRSDTLAYADIVLPAATWLEKEGTMTNSERRITYLPKVLDPPGEARADAEIILDFAGRMGWGEAFSYESPADIYAEHVKTTAGTECDISGLSYAILKERRSVQWPFRNGEGTPRLFTDHRFPTPGGRARLVGVTDENTSEPLSPDYPLILTTGRIRDQWHTMTRSGKVNKLLQHISEPFLDIHPDDAAERGIAEGTVVVVSGRRGQARAKARITDEVRPGVCFLPMHFGKIGGDVLNRTNNLTNPLFDPKSKEPDFKYTAVEVVRYVKPKEKIVVIGAGSAGLGFVQAYRQLNTDDEIAVFSREIYPFYNRVMLPDYLMGAQTWEQLVKLREDQFEALGIEVHKGVSIVSVDRENKTVTDSRGDTHAYDRLIMAAGSQAFVPAHFPKLPGIFPMRSRLDADTLLPFLTPKEGRPPRAVVIGGGLLGLELAAAFRELKVDVTIVQRSSRFMDRQLDALGCELLAQEIQDRGCEVFFNEEVKSFYGTEKLEGVRLASGRRVDCEVVIAAIGTVPNHQLARDCGLEMNRGVVVNDYLQTSDPAIFAIGEIAQWRGQMWGITVAAEQQAEAAARYIAGDLTRPYKGSLSVNILKMEGLHLVSMGITQAPDPSYEEIVFIDKAKRYYKKCLVHRDRLVGAILIGDKNEFLEFRELIANGTELSDRRLELLRSGKTADPVSGKLVCSCNNVGEGNLEKAIRGGCHDFTELCKTTGAGTGCGSCRPEVRAILEKVQTS
jgi:ferredoxin-nitrate reductase